MQEDITGLAEFFSTLSQLARERPRSKGGRVSSRIPGSCQLGICSLHGVHLDPIAEEQIREECRDIVGSDKRLDWVDRASAY
jgi:hypothetical protein